MIRNLMQNFVNRRKSERIIEYTKHRLEAVATTCWFVGFCISLAAMLFLEYIVFTHVEVHYLIVSAVSVVCLWYIPYRLGLVLYNEVMELEKDVLINKKEMN